MAKKVALNEKEMTDLLCQALETEIGGVQIYEKALECVINEELKEEFQEYLEQTREHVAILRGVFEKFGLDENLMTPGRKVVKHIGASLVKAMELAQSSGEAEAAQIVACEAVMLAETKDHANWELMGLMVEKGDLEEEQARALSDACEQVEDQEDEHLYHTTGWCRELAIEGLGLPAVIPPPEEEKDVKTAIGAARAKKTRDQMTPKHH